MKREIIKIDREKCDGCGLCIPNCPEGALQIIDDKATLVSDLYCDGLGACIGECPKGAIEIEERARKKAQEIKSGTYNYCDRLLGKTQDSLEEMLEVVVKNREEVKKI